MISNNSQPRSSMIDALGGELQSQIQENAHLLQQIVRLESRIAELERNIESYQNSSSGSNNVVSL